MPHNIEGGGAVTGTSANSIQKYTTLRLPWEQICIYISNLLSVLLGRRIPCKVMTADGDYWSISAVNDRFTNSEIISLIDYVKGGKDMFRRNIPDDSSSSRSLDMDLCQAMLSCALHLKWEVELVCEDALWITGQFSSQVKIPELNQNLIHIDSKMVDCAKLISKDELIDRLFSAGGTYSALSDICQENFHKWQTPLYWTFPISDSLHNGCYFVLVKEGVLVISYDEISEDAHEVFIRNSVRMCTAEEMSYFIDEWFQYNRELTASMEVLHSYLCRLEGAA